VNHGDSDLLLWTALVLEDPKVPFEYVKKIVCCLLPQQKPQTNNLHVEFHAVFGEYQGPLDAAPSIATTVQGRNHPYT